MVRKGISITDEDVRLKLESVDNASLYIQRLVKKDIAIENAITEFDAGSAHTLLLIKQAIAQIEDSIASGKK